MPDISAAYTSLVAYGRASYEDMIVRQVCLARHCNVCPGPSDLRAAAANTRCRRQTIGLGTHLDFDSLRAIVPALNENFFVRINETGKMYAQGTVWEGQKSIR